MISLPILAFVLFFLALREKGIEWRRAFLVASVLWGASVVGVTEILSVPRLLTRAAVAVSWAAICLGVLAFLLVLRRRTPRVNPPNAAPDAPLDRVTRGLLAAAIVIVLLVGINALVAPPDGWDAMEYHLPRVVMWMSNHSVRLYATPDYAQLIFGPWAEYAMMHTYLLWGSDRLVNLVEFFSLIGSLVGVSLIAKMLGAGARGQALAVLVCATIPEGILEASGPMNTYVLSFWITTTVAFLMLLNEDASWLNTICVGLAAGLALLTKGSAYVFLPFLVLACWLMGSRGARMVFLKRCTVFLLLIFAINAGQYARCYDLTGSPIGLPFPDGGPRLHWMVDHVSAREILANAIRNLSLHLSTPIPAVNSATEHLLRAGLRAMGVDPDDPREIWPAATFRLNAFSTDETIAADPLHLVLLLLSFGLFLWWRKKDVRPEARWYALGIIAAFLFFCAMLRWQKWASRHHQPLFVLGAVLVGLTLERYVSRRIATLASVLLLISASFFALANRTRALIPWSRVDDVYRPRPLLYFTDTHDAEAATYIAAANAVNQLDCGQIAIESYTALPASKINHSPKSFYVYPLLALIHADGRNRSVWYTDVHNLSSRYSNEKLHPAPCAVICLSCAKIPGKWDEYRPVGGRASVFEHIVIFAASGAVANVRESMPGGD